MQESLGKGVGLGALVTIALLALNCDAPESTSISKTAASVEPNTSNDTPEGSVRIHPLFAEDYACQEHWEGQLQYKGDALGSDCFITALVEAAPDVMFSRAFQNDGLHNEDWFGWRKEVLAPFDGIVKKVRINPETNEPGHLGSPPASMIIFERADGVNVLYAHIREPVVVEGDRIQAGQRVARVGNNGFGRNPHIHLGAWIGDQPLQLRHDLAAMGIQRTASPEP